MRDEIRDESVLEIEGERYECEAILGALSPLISDARLERMREVLAQRLTSVRLGLEDLHHEHNGAACIRTAEGLGLHTIMAAEVRNAYPIPGVNTGDNAEGRFERQAKGPNRSTSGGGSKKGKIPRSISTSAHRWIDLQRYHTGHELIEAAHAQGYKVYGAGPRGDMKLLDVPLDTPVVMLFGNEADGLLDETMDACDGVFQIPMYGFTESFNLSVSAGMVLEQLAARVRARLWAEGKRGELSEGTQLNLLASWATREFKPHELKAILKRFLG